MAIAYVNGSSNSLGADSTLSIDAPAIVATAHNAIIVCVSQYYTGVTIDGVDDTAGNIYTLCGSIEGGDANHKMGIYIAHDITGHATNVVTATFTSGLAEYTNILVLQYSGLALTNAYDVAASVKLDGSTTTSHATNNTDNTTQNDELVLGFYATWDIAYTITAANPPTVRQYTTGYDCTAVESIVTSTGAKSITVTSATANKLASIVRTFKMATAGATIEQEGFRFRNDDGSEAAATWKANQDTNISLAADTAARIRMLLNATGDPASIGAQLEYRYKPSGGAFGSWGKVN